MKILQVSKFYPPYKGGIELVAQMYTKAHQSLGDEVDIVSFGAGNKVYRGEFGECVNQLNTNLFLLSTPFHFSLLINPFKIFKKKYDIAYIHLHSPFIHLWLILWFWPFKLMGTRLIGIYHSDLMNQGFLGDLYQLFFKYSSFVFNEFIVSSPKLADNSKVLSSFNNVNVIPFPVGTKNVFKRRNDFKGNFLAIGRLVPYKGFEFLVNTIKETSYNLSIIGNGPLRSNLENMVKNSENIKLLGHVTDQDKERLINEADVLIVSSINEAEAYGMIIVEAFQSGLPVIASDIPTGVTYLVQHGLTGLTFKPLDKEGLLDKLKMISGGNLLEQLSVGSHEFYSKELTFEKFISNVSKLRDPKII